MLKCTKFFLLVSLACGQDPMQQFWVPDRCADGWIETESEVAGMVPLPQCCSTVSAPDTAGGRPCVFPFKYKGVEYNSCTYVESERLWCATEIDIKDGVMVPNR